MNAAHLIEQIVAKIAAQSHDDAVQNWIEARHGGNKCSPCFYSPMNERVRCAACLLSHFEFAQLKHAYPGIIPENLEAARRSLAQWIQSQS